MRFAVFASGNGSNFTAIEEACEKGQIKADLALVFCDQPTAYVLERAKSANVPAISFRVKDFSSKAAYEEEILKLLKTYHIDWLVLAGYMRLVGPTLLEAYPQKIINIHPAVLPLFPGLHGIEDAFNAGVSETGVTVHFVDAGVDSGPIIKQAHVKINPGESLDKLETRIHATEHVLYPEVLAKLFEEEI